MVSLPKHAAKAMVYAVCFWAAGSGTAHADIASILCSIYDNELVGGVGPGIATLAVMAVSISAIFGKVSFGMAVMVAVGIGILFGAPQVASAFGISGC
jgi:type IV secretory pathway VirB2 component (pilin)